MTLREIVDLSLLAKAVPDEKTTKQNMEFLQATSNSMSRNDKQKMNAVIDGLEKTNLFLKAQKQNEEKQKKLEQVKRPEGELEKTAQITNTINNTAQNSQTRGTAQVSNNA